MEKFLKIQYLSHLGLKNYKTTSIKYYSLKVYWAMIPKSFSKFPLLKFFLEDFIQFPNREN
jgi:hypothetical protein